MKAPENELWPEDYKLFATMEGHHVSENENTFFEKMRHKMEYQIAPSNDLIMFGLDNDDRIYIVRCIYDEIIVGHGIEGHYDSEHHVMDQNKWHAPTSKRNNEVSERIGILCENPPLHRQQSIALPFSYSWAIFL